MKPKNLKAFLGFVVGGLSDELDFDKMITIFVQRSWWNLVPEMTIHKSVYQKIKKSFHPLAY